MISAAWDRDPSKAFNDFLDAEPGLFLKAMDQVVGPEAVREILLDQMADQGITAEDIKAYLAAALKRRH